MNNTSVPSFCFSEGDSWNGDCVLSIDECISWNVSLTVRTPQPNKVAIHDQVDIFGPEFLHLEFINAFRYCQKAADRLKYGLKGANWDCF